MPKLARDLPDRPFELTRNLRFPEYTVSCNLQILLRA